MRKEIYSIEANGFTNVKKYDEDLNYTYYDALMNGTKVEVRVSEGKLEWRYLGIELDEIEWYALKSIEENENTTNDNIQLDEEDDIQINVLVNIG